MVESVRRQLLPGVMRGSHVCLPKPRLAPYSVPIPPTRPPSPATYVATSSAYLSREVPPWLHVGQMYGCVTAGKGGTGSVRSATKYRRPSVIHFIFSMSTFFKDFIVLTNTFSNLQPSHSLLTFPKCCFFCIPLLSFKRASWVESNLLAPYSGIPSSFGWSRTTSPPRALFGPSTLLA